MNAKELSQELDRLKTITLEAINKLIPAPEYPDGEYVMLVFNVPVSKDYGTINAVSKDNATGKVVLIDGDDIQYAIEDFPDLETIVFILGVLENKKFVVTE